MSQNFKVVISGSFQKHWKYIQEAIKNWEDQRVIVLAPKAGNVEGSDNGFVLLSSDNPQSDPDKLETDFIKRISQADLLYVVDIHGYIGRSVAAEIAYARLHNIRVIVAEDIKQFNTEFPEKVRLLLLDSVAGRLKYDEFMPGSIEGLKQQLKDFKYKELLVEEKALLSQLIDSLIIDLKKFDMSDSLSLKQNPTLKDFQCYVAEMVRTRGFDKETVTEVFMLFMEECGELAKAIRKNQGIHTDSSSEKFELANETADIFIYLLDLCNKLNIDLEQAFRDKEE